MKPTLFGYGITTKAIANKLGGGCTFYDDHCTEPYRDDQNNTILPSVDFDPAKSELEVLTPSIPPHHPLLKKAKNPISEYDFFLSPRSFDASLTTIHNPHDGALYPKGISYGHHTPYDHQTSNTPKPFTIWISGTNGKTTTTQMLTHILAKRGAIYGGNIGVPLADLDPNAPIWVLESSSYTLHHTHYASPDIYLLLPITPDHLNWHGTEEQYEADKLKPLLTMREGELALVPAGLNLPQTDAWVVEYDSHTFLENFFDLDSSQLRYKAAFLEDALLSLAITRTLFDEADYATLNKFQLDHHRQEEMTDHRGRLWVNDSKATNVDAAIQAIKTYHDRPIHLILGGDDKGADLSPLMNLIGTNKITLYSIGSNSEKIAQMALERNIPQHSCNTLAKAIEKINDQLETNEVALLSPAAASFDQFTSYVKRGEIFMEMVENLSKS